MIDIQNLQKYYSRQCVLSEVNLTYTRGQSIALIGPNGSGKTTLIKILLGLAIPDTGNIYVNQNDITKGHEYRRSIGYMPQITRFPEQLNVKQLFSLMRQLRTDVPGNNYDASLYEELSIPTFEEKRLGTLSGGMKQQVSAALAFYFNPSILILDEPTAALDPVSNEILKVKIRSAIDNNKLIITTSHILSDLEEIANHVTYLMEGKILFNDTMDRLRTETSENTLNKMVVSLLQQEIQHA
ncbi:MAG: ATP-binding cassette domain-containing protein [Bacteroidetes bacterium]|jgi:Cu-processing system ATP-binding protein|nr:ATP-binding cassette domain-containing protein [Bacteroidota bacterium]